MAKHLFLWAQLNLRSLRAAHVPDILNQGADMLSRDYVPQEEWSLHPQTVQLIWSIFGESEVDLFASEYNARCQTFFSKGRDSLAQDWPSHPLYAFPPVTMLPQVIERIRESKCACALDSPSLEEPAMVPRVDSTAGNSPMALKIPHGNFKCLNCAACNFMLTDNKQAELIKLRAESHVFPPLLFIY
jgi:hypothetical protein